MKQQLQHLKELKDVMTKEEYRATAARIVATNIKEMMEERGQIRNRMEVLSLINLKLRSFGVEEVSYGFVRNVEERFQK
ncbi:hypothetical protein [Bacillus sp. SJS]|uniref:hypothetical protein n=1 Tax=Bacillus sp. SJS TaxID=1423321 RepID=UPI0004DD8A69|nr:hypothetical protein [Bacillus sp. SJS]KZZ86227.1 hypothetical protein AS29_001235 [Bacillus sp. SJS]